ncbi:trypsin-like peptidase domain-containing protein [Candidatus Shapirobacteria bacterium]|nr:trypsin-like peptidase domain-containing protein [Candidatus Shapirobacteria bacterium]
MDEKILKTFLIGLGVGAVAVGAFFGGGVASQRGWLKLPGVDNAGNVTINRSKEVVDEESVVTRVVEKATPSVVTVSISKTNVVGGNLPPGWDVFGDFFNVPRTKPVEQKIEQDIGTGFVIEKDGLIVTNKHVVSDSGARYKVVIGKDQVVEVKDIYRDPTSDLAILKVDKTGLTPVTLGDSDQLKVGQTVIAIGTALGEFRSTVTKGVISGLGRGITAGSPLAGSERLDNVIQTDAAINPGNSGGPLFNSSGEAIGVNVAVSQEGQSIGFALPINLVKESINNFKTTGEFERPYLGVGYQMITKQSALLNDVPAGAYVKSIVEGSPAEVAGLKVGDIIVEMEGKKLVDEKNASLANMINRKKIGDMVSLKVWREDKELAFSVKLEKRK